MRGPAGGFADAVAALTAWQRDDLFQLHPGDLGWFHRLGAAAAGSAVRTWRADGRVVAVGLLDGPDLLRVAVDPARRQDRELAERVATDADRLLPSAAAIEAPPAVGEALGWRAGEGWTPLRRDLRTAVAVTELRVERVAGDLVEQRVAVQRAVFRGSTFSAARWSAMREAGVACVDLLGVDGAGAAVAAITVWSAGPGRPGLIEPMGVHPDHRGRGHGRGITLAGCAALRAAGASCAMVATPSSNSAGIAAYRSAGFEPLPEVVDRVRGQGSPSS